MQAPTRQILDNPDQHLRYMRQLAEHIQTLNTQLPKVAAAVASIPTPVDPAKYLHENGQAALTSLNVDLAAQARTNVSDVAPTATDDNTKGYNYFSRWINTTGPTLYHCIDPSPGAAVWV